MRIGVDRSFGRVGFAVELAMLVGQNLQKRGSALNAETPKPRPTYTRQLHQPFKYLKWRTAPVFGLLADSKP